MHFGKLFAGSLFASLALALVAGAALTALSSETATAAGKVSTSLGVGCRISNGDATLTFKIKASSTGTVDITGVTLTVDGATEHDSGAINTKSYQATVSVPVDDGTYDVVLTVSSDELSDKVRTAEATVDGSRCRVRTTG